MWGSRLLLLAELAGWSCKKSPDALDKVGEISWRTSQFSCPMTGTGIIQKYGSHGPIPEMYTHCSMTCFVIYSVTSRLSGFSTVFALSSQSWWCSLLLSHMCITGMQSLEKSKILGKKHNDKSLNDQRFSVSREN